MQAFPKAEGVLNAPEALEGGESCESAPPPLLPLKWFQRKVLMEVKGQNPEKFLTFSAMETRLFWPKKYSPYPLEKTSKVHLAS